jgi:hypothetical protein
MEEVSRAASAGAIIGARLHECADASSEFDEGVHVLHTNLEMHDYAHPLAGAFENIAGPADGAQSRSDAEAPRSTGLTCGHSGRFSTLLAEIV